MVPPIPKFELLYGSIVGIFSHPSVYHSVYSFIDRYICSSPLLCFLSRGFASVDEDDDEKRNEVVFLSHYHHALGKDGEEGE